jgi:nicotinamide-nucleotide amidase
MISADIITIGDEILIGQIVDTNSAWMGRELNKNGINVKRIISIHDDENEIISTLNQAFLESDIVLLTGGLGPTKDDITKHTLCKYFNTNLFFSNEVFNHLQNLLTSEAARKSRLNRTQAEVPENCTVIMNMKGTAPCMWFEKDGKVLVSMPGVPNEMEWLMEEMVIPKLRDFFTLPFIYHKTIMTQGTFEADLAEHLLDFENELPSNIKLAYLPSQGIIRLRLSASGNNKADLEREVNLYAEKLQSYIPEYVYGYDNESLSEVLGRVLKEKELTISLAESCTGGTIAGMITSIPGSSRYFKGGVVAYSNEIKTDILGVDSGDIKKYGAVSLEVAEQMAMGVRKLCNTHYAISTSGVAGPDGGTTDKPVGTVCVAIATPDKVFSKKFLFSNKREYNIRKTALTALNWLRKIIVSE